MTEHEHVGPNGIVVRHNHAHGSINHMHDEYKGVGYHHTGAYARDRYTWRQP